MKVFYRTLLTSLIFYSVVGCASIRVYEASSSGNCKEICGPTPVVYGGTVEATRYLLPPLCPDDHGAKLGESVLNRTLFAPIILPFLLVDIPLSFIEDTLLLPMTIYDQIQNGNVCDPGNKRRVYVNKFKNVDSKKHE